MTEQLILSLITGILIGAAAGYIGSLMLSKKMALVAGPLGHLTLPGIALALVYQFDILLGAFPFVLLGTLLIWFFELKTKLPMEALTAVVFSSGVATAFLFLPIDQAQVALVGDISSVNFANAIFTVLVSAFLIFITKKIYSSLVLVGVSEDLAQATNGNVRKLNLLYLVLIAIIVALGVQIVGALLTAALVAIPAAAAKNISKNLTQYALISTCIGAISICVGVILFHITHLPAGPLSILTSSAIFLISILVKRS